MNVWLYESKQHATFILCVTGTSAGDVRRVKLSHNMHSHSAKNNLLVRATMDGRING